MYTMMREYTNIREWNLVESASCSLSNSAKFLTVFEILLTMIWFSFWCWNISCPCDFWIFLLKLYKQDHWKTENRCNFFLLWHTPWHCKWYWGAFTSDNSMRESTKIREWKECNKLNLFSAKVRQIIALFEVLLTNDLVYVSCLSILHENVKGTEKR